MGRREVTIPAAGRALACAAAVVIGCVASGVPVAAEEASRSATRPSDTSRLYLYFHAGHGFQLDDRFAGDVELDPSDTYNGVLGGGLGYNLTDHWGVELQVHFTEVDLRSASRGRVQELTNITLNPALRFRYPIGDGRIVPYATVGLGGTITQANESLDRRVNFQVDDSVIAGVLGAGMDYFIAPNVSVGLAVQYFVYPEADTAIRIVEEGGGEIRDESSVDLSAVTLLGRMRFFLGQPRGPAQQRRLLLSDDGPFDSGDARAYVYGIVGRAFVSGDDIGSGVDLDGPSGFETTLGGGFGANLTARWGIDVQVAITEGELNAGLDGKLGEFTTVTVLPGVRYRHPLRGGRLVPFATASLGAAFTGLNDTRRKPFRVSIDDSSVAGALGVGIEYFLNANISFGLHVPYYIYPDWDTRVERLSGDADGGVVSSERSDTNLSGPVPQFQMRVYLP